MSKKQKIMMLVLTLVTLIGVLAVFFLSSGRDTAAFWSKGSERRRK